jgi:hypothetical protein
MRRLIGRVGLAVVIVVLAVVIVKSGLSLLLAMGTILTVAFAMAVWSSLSMARKTEKAVDTGDHKTNRAVDVTPENRVPPMVLRPAILALNDLGFRRLGEEATVAAGGKELACTWVFVSVDAQVVASLVPVRAIWGGLLAGFTTRFPHPAWLITYYPSGFPHAETITRPDLRTRHTRRSLPDAYALHRAELADFARQHGEPSRIHTMADHLAFEPVFRERHMELVLRRGDRLQMLQPYIWGGAAALFLLGTALSSVAPGLAITIFVLGISAILLCFSYLVPVPPRAARLFRLAIVLSLVLLPVSLMWHGFIAVHFLLLALLLAIFARFISADVKAFTAEIQSGKKDVDWQV